MDFDFTTFSIDELTGFYTFFRDLIIGIKDFFSSFYDVFYVLFPFFTDDQVLYFVTITSVFLGLLIYLFFRKVTI